MGFTSAFHPEEIVIDDDTPDSAIHIQVPDGQATGLLPQMRSTPYGGISGAPPFPKELLIPRNDWEPMIKEMEEKKTRLSDSIIQAKLPCKNQEKTPFCWGNAPVHCVEILQVDQNGQMVILSPASVCCPVNNFQSQGGNGEQALLQIIHKGAAPVSRWPANAIDRKYYTAETQAEAMNYRVTEWWELVPRNLDQMVSMLLMRKPGAGGYNWWGHEITLVDAVWINGAIAIRFRNSWGMNWPTPGAGGFSILQGSRMYADDLVCPLVTMAS